MAVRFLWYEIEKGLRAVQSGPSMKALQRISKENALITILSSEEGEIKVIINIIELTLK